MLKKLKGLWLEIRERWKSTSPYLFRIIQKIAAFFTFLGGIALIINQFPQVELPGIVRVLSDKTILISSVLTYIVAKLPVDTDLASKKTLKAIEDNKPE